MELLKLIKNRISTEWKKTFNDNVDILNGITRDQNQKIDVVDKRIDNLVLHSGGDSQNEVMDARVNNEAKTFLTLQSRLLAAENKHDEEFETLSITQSDQQKQMEQLNNSIGSILGTFNASVSIYVSKTRGNDETGSGTQDKPFQTIQMAVNMVPLISTADVTILIEAGTYLEDVYLNSINGNKITIRPVDDYTIFDLATQDLPVKVRSVQFSYCTGVFYVFGLQFVDAANVPNFGGKKYSLAHIQGGYMDVRKCKFADNTKSLSFRTCYSEGNVKTLIGANCYFENQAMAIASGFLADVFVGAISGSGNTIGISATSSTIRARIPASFATTPSQSIELGTVILKEQVIS